MFTLQIDTILSKMDRTNTPTFSLKLTTQIHQGLNIYILTEDLIPIHRFICIHPREEANQGASMLTKSFDARSKEEMHTHGVKVSLSHAFLPLHKPPSFFSTTGWTVKLVASLQTEHCTSRDSLPTVSPQFDWLSIASNNVLCRLPCLQLPLLKTQCPSEFSSALQGFEWGQHNALITRLYCLNETFYRISGYWNLKRKAAADNSGFAKDGSTVQGTKGQ